MQTKWWTLALLAGASGCGIVEGSEQTRWDPCEIVASSVMGDRVAQELNLPSPGPAIDLMTGTFPVSAQLRTKGVTAGSVPGTMTIRRAGDPIAEQRAQPAGGEGCPKAERDCNLACIDGYRVPLEVTLRLDGGALSVSRTVEIDVIDEVGFVGTATPQSIPLTVSPEAPRGDTWFGLDEVETNLDLRSPDDGEIRADRIAIELQANNPNGTLRPVLYVFLGAESDTQDQPDSWLFLFVFPPNL